MAKFGRFESGGAKPIETYEGDYMLSETSYVRIFKGPDTLSPNFSQLVATIHLDRGQSVQQIQQPEKPARG